MASKTLYWLQCGACGGDSMALLGVESPDLVEALVGIETTERPGACFSIEEVVSDDHGAAADHAEPIAQAPLHHLP